MTAIRSSIWNNRFLSFLLALLLLAAAPVSAAAQGEIDQPWAVAKKITLPSELLEGPEVEARLGDYLIENDQVRFVISAPDHQVGFARSGGHVIDADVARRGPGKDELHQVFTTLGDPSIGQVVYERIDVLHSGDFGRPAALRLHGHYSEDRRVAVETTCTLEPASQELILRTTITNNSSRNYPVFAIGETLHWGRAQAFCPDYGFDLGSRALSTGWVAAQGASTAYGWALPEGEAETTHGPSWTKAQVSNQSLPVGETLRFERSLYAGLRDISSLYAAVAATRGAETAVFEGVVEEAGSQERIEDAVVLALGPGEVPVSCAVTSQHGRFELVLPPGTWQLVPQARGRNPHHPPTLTIDADQTRETVLQLQPAGRLRFNVFDESGQLGPARLTFKGVGQTPDPRLGPAAQAGGARNTVLTVTGQGEALIPPGDYDVYVSRGPEFNLYRGRITVAGGSVTHFQANLMRAFDTRGWIACDFHFHTEASPDCQVSLEDRVASLVAEGVEFGVATDHNTVTDLSPVVRQMGLNSMLLTAAGMEVTTNSSGHFGIWPLVPREERRMNGSNGSHDLTVREIYGITRTDPGDEIFQVNHPRQEGRGYFDLFNYNPITGTADRDFFRQFEAMEVWTGKDQEGVPTNLADWYGFLNNGFRSTAIGCSASHLVAGQEVGYPRTYVATRDDSPDKVSEGELVHALRRGYALVTNGPFIGFTANDKQMGELVGLNRNGEVDLKIQVQAADWIDVSEMLIIENGETVSRIKVQPSLGPSRYDGTIKRRPEKDAWYIVMVRGSRPLEPVVGGNAEAFTPLAFTNPVFIDADGDGEFNALRVSGIRGATPIGR